MTVPRYLVEKAQKETGCDEVALVYDLNAFEKVRNPWSHHPHLLFFPCHGVCGPTCCDCLAYCCRLTARMQANADNRGMKFLLEIFQNHFPGRVGVAYVVNSPFFYRLLWKLVKPWLSGDLLSKAPSLPPWCLIASQVTMLSSYDGLNAFFTKQNLLPELGGTKEFNLEKVCLISSTSATDSVL